MNSHPSYTGNNTSAQLAADSDDYRTAVSRACSSQSIATIGPHNISHVHNLYTVPVPPRQFPPRIIPPQSYSLPGDICRTISLAAKNKGTGVNADSIDLFVSLVKCPIPTIKPDLRFIFDLIYRNQLPDEIRRYFTDVYLFCLHKDPTDATKLRPLGIPTAIRRLIASHVARTLRDKFSQHLLPYNYAVGVPNGSDFVVKAMQLAIERYIEIPQKSGSSPTRAAIFFDLTNQFNSVSRAEFFDVIHTSFPELIPLTTLFYAHATPVHHKWNDGSWRLLFMEEGVSQGCPLSPLLASFVVARLLEPIALQLHSRAAARLALGDSGDDGNGGVSHLLSFVDDISSCIYLQDLHFLCTTLQTSGATLGCFVNCRKTRILTSCSGCSPLPLLQSTNPSLALQVSSAISTFSVTPHPSDPSSTIPVELTTGFRLLGHPVGSAQFATDFFTSRLTAVTECISTLTTSIHDEQTKLKLFSMCLLQKLPHLLASDVLYHLPTDHPSPNWIEWNGPLTLGIESIIVSFLESLLPSSTPLTAAALLISQVSLSNGGLGLLCPRARAAPDFVLTLRTAIKNARAGFTLHRDLLPFKLHHTLSDLFNRSSNPSSLILQRYHCLLPDIASVACGPSTPPATRTSHFLTSVSTNSARDRISAHCSSSIIQDLYHEVYTSSPQDIHLLPSLLSPQTSYPLISMCRSIPTNRLPPWIFNPCLKRKLRLPLFAPGALPVCPCGTSVDPFGDHLFQCRRICKIAVHNAIRDGFATALVPLLSSAGYILPSSKFEIEPQLFLPSDPHARPFDLAFHPDPSSPPQITHACPFTTIGIDITIGSTPSHPTFDPTSSDVLSTLTANADSHLQTYEKRKLGRANKTSPSTHTLTRGDDLIHDLLQRNMILLPFAIDPLGRFGPILQNFLLDTPPRTPIQLPPSKRHGTIMYSKLLSFPSPKGLFKLADHNWKANPSRRFFGHSYSAPTPSITTIQQLGLSITKAFAVHFRYSFRRIKDHASHSPPPRVSVPFYSDR